jgi:hypothetical protein
MHVPQTVGAYLVYSFLYYQMDTSAISDVEYDALCRNLLDRYDSLITHPHFHLLKREALMAGTGFHIATTDYPNIVVQLAHKEMENPGYLARVAGRSDARDNMYLEFKMAGADYCISSDANCITLAKIAANKNGDRVLRPLCYGGSLAYIVAQAGERALKSSEAEGFEEVIAILKRIEADTASLTARLRDLEPTPPAGESGKAEQPIETVTEDDDLFM